MRGREKVHGLVQGSGCGAVGRVVASDTRDPRFESSHWQIYLLSIVVKAVLKRRK